jgi:hypothetical protein
MDVVEAEVQLLRITFTLLPFWLTKESGVSDFSRPACLLRKNLTYGKIHPEL